MRPDSTAKLRHKEGCERLFVAWMQLERCFVSKLRFFSPVLGIATGMYAHRRGQRRAHVNHLPRASRQ
jgi:hypothetical protein